MKLGIVNSYHKKKIENKHKILYCSRTATEVHFVFESGSFHFFTIPVDSGLVSKLHYNWNDTKLIKR